MRTIVMTGATAGIGLAAAERIRQAPETRLLVGARGNTAGESLPLDLARLQSVRSFAAAIEQSLGEARIDALVLNAGIQFGDVSQRTEDGFETTFAVNHLAHYLLLRLLMPRLAVGAVVVITTSDTHDPKLNWFAPPLHADALALAKGQLGLSPASPPSRPGFRAYSTSKLCNLLTARALAASTFAQQQRLSVIAFNPGLTPGTQLARNYPRVLRALFNGLMPIVSPMLRLNTAGGGGAWLAALALGQSAAPAGRVYASQVKRQLTWPDPSELARDDAVTAKLWHDSAALVGLNDSTIP